MAALERAGVILAIPTAPPPCGPTQRLRDTGEPVPGEDGHWYQQWAIDEVPTPPPVRSITPLEFLNRLPAERMAALLTAVQSTPAGLLWYSRLVASSTVDLDAPETQQGLAFFRMAGVLTEGDVGALTA